MPLNVLNRSLLKVVAGRFDPFLQLPIPAPQPGPRKLTVVEKPGSVVFQLDGAPVWSIDVQAFSGSAALTVTHRPLDTVIELKSAFFPATQLPADFVCTVHQPGNFGTLLELAFALGNFQGKVVAERWLAGLDAMPSVMTLDTPVCDLGASGHLTISGDAQGTFFPDWRFEISAANLATIDGLAPPLTSGSFSLKLLKPDDPSLSSHPKSKRTHIGLASAGDWQLKPAVLDLPIGQLQVADGLFDRIDIEAGEGAAGDIARVLAASSMRSDGLTLQLAGDATDLLGNPASLKMSHAIYAIAFDSSADGSQGDDVSVSAGFTSLTSLFSLEGFVLLAGGAGNFQADAANGQVTSVLCEPFLLGVAAPMKGHPDENVFANPLPVAAGTLLPIVATPGATPGWGVSTGPSVPGKPRLSLPDFSVSVVRREDLLSLEFTTYNLALEAGGGQSPRLARKDSTADSYLVVHFNSPQHIAEQAFLETSADGKGKTQTGEAPAQPPVRAVAAGPSRLAFHLPTGIDSLPYSIDSLLDWVRLEPSVAPVAFTVPLVELLRPQPVRIPPRIREPLSTETAIEAPWRLFLSPDQFSAWAHSASARTLGNRTELWHTRLAVRAGQDDETYPDETLARAVRAVWSPDYTPDAPPPHAPEPPPPPTFRTSLDALDRDEIVRLSSDFTILRYGPRAIAVEKLFLSTLGAWMDVFGDWDPPLRPPLSVQQWRHKAAMGRDNYVRVVYGGYLVHGGHRASLVKVTERKFQQNPTGNTTAYLRQSFFLIVREPEKDYSFLAPSDQRGLPYGKLRITTLVTPQLDPPKLVAGLYSFVPMVNNKPFLFHLVGTDKEGKTSEFTSPLHFVELGGDYGNAVAQWEASSFRTRDLAGQNVAFAASAKPGDTTLNTANLTIGAKVRAGDPPFFPWLDNANVNVPPVEQLTGKPGAVPVKYYPNYLSGDFGPGGVFLATGSTLPVGFRGDQSGGVATPNLQVSGLSRRFGVVSGAVDKIASGNFDPKEAFGDLNARLFGVVPLKDLIQAVFGDETVPKLLTEHLPDAIETKLHWAPTVNDYSLGPIALKFDNTATALSLDAIIRAPLNGSPPETSIKGSLNGFALTLASVVGIKFSGFSFDAAAGKKLVVSANVEGDGLQFLGDLSFLNQLRKCIPSDGFQDPPSLDVTPEGVTAGYSLAIPTIGVGVFSIENLRLSAALTLPFVTPAPLRFRFAFSEREHPFLITVSLLGGGGFFGISLGPDGIEMLEASFEIGANVSISVVVASGNVHIMAGVYLKLDFVSKESQLTGYLRAGGTLDVLGLISASVEFYLGFTYYFGPPCKIAGEATVTIEVHVLFFSASVHASLRREFSDPKISFADLIGPTDWDDYCDAFAA